MDQHKAIASPGRPWYDMVSERTGLVRWLIDENRLDPTDIQAVLDVIERPGRYGREYTEYARAMTVERAALLLRRAA